MPFPKAEGLLNIGDFLSKVDRGTLATYLLNLLPTALRGRLLGARRRKPAGRVGCEALLLHHVVILATQACGPVYAVVPAIVRQKAVPGLDC